jgi:peptidoglycan/xylan/chitin deacetylase (PgdA/CDA1 family)
MPGLIASWLYPDAVFRIRTAEKVLYLTFDDGPDPVSTPAILKILEENNIRATFFCCGSSAEKQPDLIEAIKIKGNCIGNHGWKHPDGWNTPDSEYISDISMADKITSSTLFRPPYGHVSLKQYKKLKEKYKIIFWDIMPYDFDERVGARKSLQLLKSRIRNGSVIVLHDDRHSTCTEFLEEFITYAVKEGYRFDILT